MKRLTTSLVCLSMCTVLPAQARDTKLLMPIKEGLAAPNVEGKLSGKVKFYFGDETTPAVLEKLGSDSTSNKTNAFNKTDAVACNWAFMSSMLALEKRALQLGANAVVNIVSNYKHAEFSSPTEFECHSGALIAGVALKGNFVKLAN